jgi:very-short-patch-repair endonuclease
MATEPENPTARALRQVDAKRDALLERFLDMTDGSGSLEDHLVRTQGEVSTLRADFVRMEHRLDRFDEKLLRIERRLDLIQA